MDPRDALFHGTVPCTKVQSRIQKIVLRGGKRGLGTTLPTGDRGQSLTVSGGRSTIAFCVIVIAFS